jgi:uncharacterized protein YjiS (DUF1127 family)
MWKDCTDTSWPIPIVSRPSRLAGLRRLSTRLLARLVEWRERARSRDLLRQLDDRMLRDAGLTRSDVARECAKQFWQP